MIFLEANELAKTYGVSVGLNDSTIKSPSEEDSFFMPKYSLA